MQMTRTAHKMLKYVHYIKTYILSIYYNIKRTALYTEAIKLFISFGMFVFKV